tara:strand:+ start:308 stop:466 length:159 start_codon:yes stop_codon:yes gene_type:complete
MLGFFKKLKCRLKSCCGSSLSCGEAALKIELENERKKYIKEEVESFKKNNYI